MTNKQEPVVLRFEGTFDAAHAAKIRGALEALPRDAEVVVEFTHRRGFQDFLLAFVGTRAPVQATRRLRMAGGAP